MFLWRNRNFHFILINLSGLLVFFVILHYKLIINKQAFTSHLCLLNDTLNKEVNFNQFLAFFFKYFIKHIMFSLVKK